MVADLAAAFHRAANLHGSGGFEAYFDDPVAFTQEVLGFEPWEGQKLVMRAIATHDAVTVPAGRAVGKSRLDGAIALWFVATRGPNSRVICTGPTNNVVQQVFWEELRNLFTFAKKPIRGECAKKSTTGLRTSEGAQVLGLTAERPEGFQGIRAGNMLVIVDEASGVDDTIFEVIEGNMAGGSKLLLTGNPTKSKGFFRESFRSDRFVCINLPSTDSPNVVAGEVLVKGLATREWLDERKRVWGEDSPIYKIHVLGQVVEGLEGQLFPYEMVTAAKALWPLTQPTGRLVVGVDPAGASQTGDDSAFAARRGNKVCHLYGRKLKSEEDHLAEVLGLIASHRGDSSEIPLVVVDRDGDIGARVYGILRSFQVTHEDVFQLIGIRGGEKARRKPLVYDRVRDELWFGLVDMFRNGLTIPEEPKLERDLSEIKAEAHVSGKSKVTSKDELRTALDGRSPDRGDALTLCCFEVREWKAEDVAPKPAPPPIHHDPYIDTQQRGIDVYGSLDWASR